MGVLTMRRTVISAVALSIALGPAACGGNNAPTHKADPYCPAALAALPASAPGNYTDALNGITTLTQAIPGPKDQALTNRILKVQEAMAVIGHADIGIGTPTADDLASYYKAASALRAWCKP
jgi:hypothetical protein